MNVWSEMHMSFALILNVIYVLVLTRQRLSTLCCIQSKFIARWRCHVSNVQMKTCIWLNPQQIWFSAGQAGDLLRNFVCMKFGTPELSLNLLILLTSLRPLQRLHFLSMLTTSEFMLVQWLNSDAGIFVSCRNSSD